MTDSLNILDLKDVQFAWPGRASFYLSVSELSIPRSKSVLLLGESGSGKSTLLSLICGTLLADAGCVAVAGTDIASLGASARDRFRAEQIGLIFQQFNLLPFASVHDNILLPLQFAPKRRARVKESKADVANLCHELGLAQDVLDARANTLSVGQQQRVAAARALIGTPPLIIADEPTSALDADTQAIFLNLLFAQAQANGTSVLMVSHDARLGEKFDGVIQMDDVAQTERGSV